jgi:hypothetical protein
MDEGRVMSIENARDPRVTLMREKYFTMRPKPLERWVWQQGLPASAERVYWYHWDLGAQNGSWCSQVPIRIVARDCCLDPATVTRAYQLLKRLSLVRREDPGRDPGNPFQQATSVTEVRVPRDVVVALGREPNRRSTTLPPVAPPAAEASPVTPLPPAAELARDQSRTVFGKLSAGERTRFAQSSAHRRNSLEFDGDTRLNPMDRAHVLATLESLARARPVTTQRAEKVLVRGRRLAALDLVKVRNGVRTLERARCQTLPASLMTEIVYAVEEGALAKFPVALAVNIALKKVREGLWSSPNRMPPEWSLRRALPELCTTAGGI